MPVGAGWWLSGNKGNRAPNRYVFLDCEALERRERARRVQTFRLAVASLSCRRDSGAPWEHGALVEATDTAGLWDVITGWTRARQRTVLVAHNLGYDLRISDALGELGARGWSAGPPLIGPKYAIFNFVLGRRRLTMVDSLNWLPTSLDRLGAMVGVPKLPLPAWEADDETWFARCRRDVEILRAAWFTVQDWREANAQGAWRPSGAGAAMGAWRHRFK